MLSVWEKQSFYHPTDILIVGAGLTGLLSAIKIKEAKPSLSIRIVERGLYPAGASVKNAGFACYGSVSEILDDIRSEGENTAFTRVIDRYHGLQDLFSIVGKEDIQLRTNGGMEVFTPDEQDLLEESLDSIGFLNSHLSNELDFEPFFKTNQSFGFNTLNQSVGIRHEATLHSGLLMTALLKKARALGVEINFGVSVHGFEKQNHYWEVETHKSSFRSQKVIVATNGFSSRLFKEKPILPGRGQIVLTSPIPDLLVNQSIHLHQGYFYFREFEGRVLLGGGRHLDRVQETTDSQETSEPIQTELERLLHKIILPGKKFSIENRWAGTMAFGPENEKEPIVEDHEGMVIAARLGGMGVAMSSLVAKKSKDLILK